MLLGTVPCDFKDFRWQLATNIRMMDAFRQAQDINGNNLASNDAILLAGTLLLAYFVGSKFILRILSCWGFGVKRFPN